MPEEDKQNEQKAIGEKPAAVSETTGQSKLFKPLLFGAGLVIVIVIVAAVGMYFFNAKSSNDADDNGRETAQTTSRKLPDRPSSTDPEQPQANEGDDLEVGEGDLDLDQSAIDKIMESLDFLDYEPSQDELAEEEGRMTKEDSLQQVNWLEKEKAALAGREKELTTRQREVEKLEREVNKKLVNLEQVESARTAQLAKLYDGMDPRAVANLLANLDDKTVVAILPRMKLKNASAVLQLMPAQRAAKLSKQMITIVDG